MPNILITAGPTREPLDPVRYISNRSSGKMGLAIAKAFAEKKANVKLITGPTKLEAGSWKLEVTKVETAEEMRQAVLAHLKWADIIIMAAAVADYKPKIMCAEKIKKGQQNITLELEKTPDILAELGQKKRDNQILVGFALETENLLENAKKKLKEKNLDLIIANSEKAQDADMADFILLSKKSCEHFKNISKKAFSQLLVQRILPRPSGKRVGVKGKTMGYPAKKENKYTYSD